MLTTNLKPWTEFPGNGLAHPPLPIRRGGKRRAPVEARDDWGPWLPVNEAYPEIPTSLKTFAWIVLMLALLSLTFLVFVQMAF
jgi:hypothetical protein